ncbi:hypothetical protein BBD42_17095 [Paenibacillus sp. BIHB 4019]|uniref:HTH lysR-type domain-containing protein n=1 Tax=Paenibacillus sp. BIHB 4019 TaxID=1870819 RepID=A0A1B2DJX1_9BACL|nr:LysR family transcriptional regulator [Paenibacillus sp. BIHB 4019]ANY67999.1 hypothetical protein BBD42_17095 [Paenibacillus sp. BIHB 4019]
MNIDQLIYVAEVAKYKSITVAAEHLMVTQSTISQAVTRLEEELDIKLFSRSRLGAFPTAEAATILDKCLQIVNTVHAMKEDARNQQLKLSGELLLTVIPGGMPLLIHTLSSIKKDYPLIKFELSEKNSGDILKDVRNHKTHAGLIVKSKDDLDFNGNGLEFHPLREGKIVICASKHSPLAAKKKVAARELLHYNFVLYSDEFIDQFIVDLGELCGPIPILFRTDQSNAIASALSQNLAITVGHDYSFLQDDQIHNGNLVLIEVEDLQQRPFEIGWLKVHSKQPNRLIELFMERFNREASPLLSLDSEL